MRLLVPTGLAILAAVLAAKVAFAIAQDDDDYYYSPKAFGIGIYEWKELAVAGALLILAILTLP